MKLKDLQMIDTKYKDHLTSGEHDERWPDQANFDPTRIICWRMGLMQVSNCQVSPFTSCKKSLFDNSRAHIDRVKKAEGVETDEKECPEPEAETGGAMNMTASTSSLLTITSSFLAIFFKLSHL